MNSLIEPRYQRTLTLAGLVLAAFVVGVQAVSGGWLIALGLPILLALLAWQRARPSYPEALALAGLLFGYIAGNRGFAQLGLGPIFVGEACLALLGLAGLRFFFVRGGPPYRVDLIGLGILLFTGFGLIRLLGFDLARYGFLALRDFALVYYAVFYFLAQPVARDANSRRLVEVALLAGCTVAIPGYLLFMGFREFFVSNLLVGGNPLVFYKGDLVACYFGGAFAYGYALYERTRRPAWLLLGLVSMLLMLHTTNRAALPGFALTLGILMLAGARRAPWITLGGGLLLAIPAIWLSLAAAEDYRQTRVWSIFEHTASLVDFNGTFHYTNREASSSGDNNRFRLIWWQTVWHETTERAPLTGLGFGYSLSAAFVETYYQSEIDNFTARSPHSVIVTLYGRTGVIGLALASIVVVGMGIGTTQAVARSRREGRLHPTLPHWCWCWMILSGAAFGVVLEGPMGAIPFWVVLALATEGLRQPPESTPQPADDPQKRLQGP